ncbi:hypothetical protein G7025_21465 [Pseudomonas lurida]|jgi:hypothetical protein|uniref:hypothetical protein n=1 Tax=Pseudomonas TaxID=286 RepID=UPI0015E28F1C|nr:MULTISPECIES: hypothetical protein [Pseudomonas]MBA1295940.1 hypothetical protein [Pseudomonas lurida]
MSEVKVLEKLLESGSLDNEDAKVRGIAQLAVGNGFDHLSELQKIVLKPYLNQSCDGVTDPGGYHNECQENLQGDELAAALGSQAYYGSLLCEKCIDEKEQYDREWERIDRE